MATVGNWTIVPLTVDTISTSKSLTVPDLDYSVDFSVSERSQNEVKLLNTTGTSLLPVEQLRYGRREVANVYKDTGIPAGAQCTVKSGIRTLNEVRYFKKATNNVSGQELLLPYRGWIALQVPSIDIVTSADLLELYSRVVASGLATGSTDESLLAAIARGDLDPTA